MDLRTLQAYDSAPEAFATEWQEQPPPIDMYDLVKQFFVPGRTADVGCGSGRDAAWLADNDFLPIGYDASNPLLAILEPTGTLYLSWRVTEGSDHRDDLGRLYSAFDSYVVTDALSTTSVLHESVVTSASSGRVIRRVIVRNTHPR